jgi:N-methylhydantoinase A
VLSAVGLAAAAERVDVVASFHRPLEGLTPAEWAAAFRPLLSEAARLLPGGTLLRSADGRFTGQGYELTVPVMSDDPDRVRHAFLVAHQTRYGHAGSEQAIEIVNLRVVAVRPGPAPTFQGARRAARAPEAHRAITVGPDRLTAAVWALDELAPGVTIDGPAILAGCDATALLEPAWRGTVHPSGAVLVERR